VLGKFLQSMASSKSTIHPFWSDARAQMLLDPTVANLNTGSFGPLPRVVFDEVTRLRHRLAEEPMDFLLRQAPLLLWQARERLAALLRGDPYRMAFTANVTAAINTIAASLRLAAPGEILMTDHEYGAMQWTWERAAQRQGLTLRTFPLPVMAETPEEIVRAACAAFTDKTRLFFFSHVLSPTGLVLPAQELCREARRQGVLTVIDGAHAPGMVPVRLDEIGSDFYGGNCHKWILAPTGSGFLYFAPGNDERIQPLQVSWGSYHDHAHPDDRDEFGATPRLRAFEFEGVRDPSPWIAVRTAIDFQDEIGVERIRARIEELSSYVRERLTRFRELQLATPAHPALHGAMTAFRLPAGIDAVALRRALWERRIELPVIERPEGLSIRVSTHFYNTQAEVDQLADALPALLADCSSSA
jgi:isopenicillin-N epimerase